MSDYLHRLVRTDCENVVGTFVRDEEVVGNDSGAIGTIREVGTGYIVLKIKTKRQFTPSRRLQIRL